MNSTTPIKQVEKLNYLPPKTWAQRQAAKWTTITAEQYGKNNVRRHEAVDVMR